MVKERESGQNEGLRSEENTWFEEGAYRREESVQSGGSNLGE
jgi:hypothetical protein